MKKEFNPKKKCIYIKNIYIQPSKNQKLLSATNSFIENKKIISDYNVNNQALNFYPKQKNKNILKSFYKNVNPQKQNNFVRDNQDLLSSKNIHYKSTTKKIKEKLIPLDTYSGSNISRRKLDQKNYQISNPFKERSNSENSINYFNRTYTFFNNHNIKDIKSSYLKSKPVDESNLMNISKQIDDSANISCANINKKINNFRNDPNNKENLSIKSKNSSCSCSFSRTNGKKYFYQEHTYKPQNNEGQFNPMSPNINFNTSSKINMSSINTPSNYKENTYNNNTNKNAKRIQKYILSDKKRKLKSRQNFKEYKDDNLCKSTFLPKDLGTNIQNKNKNYFVKNTPNRSEIESKFKQNKNLQNSPSVSSFSNMNNNSNTNSNYDSKSQTQKYNWMKENNNLYFNNNILNYNNYKNNNMDSNNFFDSNSTLDGYFKVFNKIDIEGIGEYGLNSIKGKELFEQSALIIQSVFRGYLVKSKFESLLYNFKGYDKASEILEELFNLYFKKDLNDDKQKFMDNLKEIKNKKVIENNYSNFNVNKSYNGIKVFNSPLSPSTESEVKNKSNKFIDMFLHKEIGERFNILKNNENKEKEMEKKHKEELDEVNDRMNKIIEENNMLKDLNEKNKYKEKKFQELSNENKKKENIINIITNDNQNLARRLKIIKDKYNNLEIHKQPNINININLEDKKVDQYNNSKELFFAYRNFYLLYLIYKKNYNILDTLRRYFFRYRNIITNIIDINKYNFMLKKEKLNNLMTILKNREKNNIYHSFYKLYYSGIINYKETEYKNDTINEKLINLIINKENKHKSLIKRYFHNFYDNGIISQLNEENNQNIKLINAKILNNLKKLIISVELRKNKYYKIKLTYIFEKWNILSKMLAMKAVTDEKKRKKRQKQRTKKKIEKNKSANKYYSYNTGNFNLNIEKNNINILNKVKDKETFNFLEHSITTDFSGHEVNMDNKNDKITKATDKLTLLFFKAAMSYRLNNNKNINLNLNKENNNENEKNMNGNNDKKEIEIKDNNESDGDSGESSFGL